MGPHDVHLGLGCTGPVLARLQFSAPGEAIPVAMVVGVLRAGVPKAEGCVGEGLVAGKVEHVPAGDVDTAEGHVG